MASLKRAPLPAVTGVRILLAVWVLLLHMATFSPAFGGFVRRTPAFVQDAIESGAAAVGVFFLLSGFVLAYNYDLSSSWSWPERKRFWIARAARIYPVYGFALVVGIPSLIAGLAKAGPLHPAPVLVGCTSVLLLLQAWIPQDAQFWGGPAWSLSAEAFFYLVFPFAGRMLWKMESRRAQIFSLAALWLGTCVTAYLLALAKAPFFLGHAAQSDTGWSAVIKFNPLLRLPEFLAGIVLCKLFVSFSRHPSSWFRAGAGSWLYLAGFGVALALVGNEHLLPPAVLHDGLLLPASSAVILGLSFGGGAIWRWLSRPVAITLGQASYSLYLLHMPINSYFAAANKRVVHSAAEAWISLFLYVVVVFLASGLTFWKLEEPARRAILSRWSGREVPRLDVASLKPADADPF